MERPTIWSSGPDAMGRTVRTHDEMARRAHYGRIQPMEGAHPLRSILSRFIPLS
ncbi:MAG: hypothetical protein V2I39_02380 [Erythrobacter sp.]|jgi:hypothetical protein|nr:hypothetical protein [Erythrobacter sp.]